MNAKKRIEKTHRCHLNYQPALDETDDLIRQLSITTRKSINQVIDCLVTGMLTKENIHFAMLRDDIDAINKLMGIR